MPLDGYYFDFCCYCWFFNFFRVEAVGHIIYGEYIVFQGWNILCSLAYLPVPAENFSVHPGHVALPLKGPWTLTMPAGLNPSVISVLFVGFVPFLTGPCLRGPHQRQVASSSWQSTDMGERKCWHYTRKPARQQCTCKSFPTYMLKRHRRPYPSCPCLKMNR